MSEETKEEKLKRMRNFAQLICLANDSNINEAGIQKLEAVAKLRDLKSEIYNKEEPIPIGDIHGDSQLFLGWMLSSGAATIDQNNPIIEHRTKNSNGEDIITNIFNLKPNPNFNGKLVFLGDYIDRGPDSEAILLTLINFLNNQKVQGLENVVAILGNHEINLLKKAENSAMKIELENNLHLFKLIHIIGDNIYSHTNTFSDDVYPVGDKKESYKIDVHIINKLRVHTNNERIELIKKNKDFGTLVSPEHAKNFSRILNFYNKEEHTKNGIKRYADNVNNLLNIYRNKNVNNRTKNTALTFMSSLSSIRAKNQSRAAYLSETRMTLYKGHDMWAKNGRYVKNMDIGASCYIRKSTGKSTDFYLRNSNKIISLRESELNEAFEYLKDIKNKSNIRRHVRMTENSIDNFDKNSKTLILKASTSKNCSDKIENTTISASSIILQTRPPENEPKPIRHIRKSQNFVDILEQKNNKRKILEKGYQKESRAQKNSIANRNCDSNLFLYELF